MNSSPSNILLPVKHDPLGTGGNAVMALIESREASQNCIIIIGHNGVCVLADVMNESPSV